VRNTRPIFWIFVPILLAIATGAIWGTANYGPLGKPSPALLECSTLRAFVENEEESGKSEWQQYRTLIDEYLSLPDTSNQRIPIIEEMASTVVGVLGHDLAIYKEMDKFPSCVVQEKRSELPGLIEETESAINFLNGSTPINGNYFDPNIGTWNTAFYEEYLSALEYLKDAPKTSA
jgi:hypothetical protein